MGEEWVCSKDLGALAGRSKSAKRFLYIIQEQGPIVPLWSLVLLPVNIKGLLFASGGFPVLHRSVLACM